jgi:Putative S-adenosyl-L-methionine-dependent methyltransferase
VSAPINLSAYIFNPAKKLEPFNVHGWLIKQINGYNSLFESEPMIFEVMPIKQLGELFTLALLAFNYNVLFLDIKSWVSHFNSFLFQIWYSNVPHTQLVKYKGHQNWIKVSGEYLTFPGGGTQFKHGVSHYINFIQEVLFLFYVVYHF